MIPVIISVPGCIFALDEFSHARPVEGSDEDIRIEFKKKGWIIIRDFPMDKFEELLYKAQTRK